MWQPQVEALFDICVNDTDALSYRRRSPVSVLDSGAIEKKRVYYSAVEDRRGNFTAFVRQLMACCSVMPRTSLNVYLPA